MPRADIPDAALLLLHWAAAREALARRGALILAGGIVQEVLPVARRAAIFELTALLREKAIGARQREAGQLVLAPPRRAGDEVGEAVRVAGDEVDRTPTQP